MPLGSNKCLMTIAGLAIFGAVAAAQPPSPLLNVNRVVVKPDRLNEFIDIETKIREASQKGGLPWRNVWRSYLGQAYEFVIVTPLENYAARDTPPPVTKGLKEGELASLMARRAQCIESSRMTIERPLPDLSIANPNAAIPPMIRMIRTRVRPGMADQYIALMKDELLPAYKKIGMPGYRMRRIEWGGSRNDFTTNMPMDKMAELDGDSWVVKALGQDGARKYLDKVSQLISASEYMVYRHQPALSIRAAQ